MTIPHLSPDVHLTLCGPRATVPSLAELAAAAASLGPPVQPVVAVVLREALAELRLPRVAGVSEYLGVPLYTYESPEALKIAARGFEEQGWIVVWIQAPPRCSP